MRGFGRLHGSLLALALLAACTGSGGGSVPSAATRTTPAPATSGPGAGSTALIPSLPAGCDGGIPSDQATISFVAKERAWAVRPDGESLTCLFEVDDPGPFKWGPRADRVVLGGLEVRGVGSEASRPAGSLHPAAVTWGRPSGSAVVFIDPKGKELEKASVGSAKIEIVTPAEEEGHFPSHVDVSFQHVIYHPSGLALGFVLTDYEGSSVWISSNTGADPHRLVWSRAGTVFGPIAFGPDGKTLYYAAHVANGRRIISVAELEESRVRAGLWQGQEDVLSLLPAPSGQAVAIDTGTGCDDRRAILSRLDETEGTPLMPGAAGPTSVIGWLDDATLLIGEGGCDGPTKLWRVGVDAGAMATLVLDGVDRAAVRVPDPTPAPVLPNIPVNEEFA